MNIIYKKCPSCNAKINIFTKWLTNGCKYKTDFSCFYCPHCKKQISSSYHVKYKAIINVSIIILAFILSKITISFFQILPNFPNPIKIIPMLFIYSFLLNYILIRIWILKYFEKDENPDNLIEPVGEIKSWDGQMDLNKDIRITPFENKVTRYMIISPVYFAIFVIIGFLLILIFK